jgi:hypothetical protein
MSQQDKLIIKFKTSSKNFSWQELTKLLTGLGFVEMPNKKTGGSRRKFFNKNRNVIINLHKPHPSPLLKEYAVKQVKDKLIEEELI